MINPWCHLIISAYGVRASASELLTRPQFYPPVSAARLAEAEQQLQVALPASLRGLYLETDGVMEMLALGSGEEIETGWQVWTLAEVIEQNRSRSRPLLFFAGAGVDGIRFGFPIDAGGTCGESVVVWYPLRAGTTELAPTLADFLSGWLAGTLFV